MNPGIIQWIAYPGVRRGKVKDSDSTYQNYEERKKPDPFLKVGAVNIRHQKSDSNYVWALRDINIEVKEGEVLGIIGKNGAALKCYAKAIEINSAQTVYYLNRASLYIEMQKPKKALPDYYIKHRNLYYCIPYRMSNYQN